MNLRNVFQHLAAGSAICLPLLTTAAMLIPGCAGTNSDLLTALRDRQSAETAEAAAAKAPAGEEEVPAPDAQKLIADKSQLKENVPVRLSTLSTPESERPRKGFGQRMRAILGRSDKDLTTADPFINDAESAESPVAAAASATSENKATVEELLASMETPVADKKPRSSDPWWQERTSTAPRQSTAPGSTSTSRGANPLDAGQPKFAEEFDSRLDRLRAELSYSGTGSAADAEGSEFAGETTRQEDVNPFAESRDSAAALPEVRSRETAPTQASLFSDECHPLTTLAEAEPADEAKARIHAMLADAHRDWENWNLRRAYRTALDAQELAVLENVTFLPGEERPEELAHQISDALHGDALATAAPSHDDLARRAPASVPGSDDAENPFAVAETLAQRQPAAVGFSQNAEPQQTWAGAAAQTPQESGFSEIRFDEVAGEVRGSGVSLLPPDDDFPSDAEESTWGAGLSALRSRNASSAKDVKDIQLTTHKSPGFTLTRSQLPSEQLPGISTEDNRQLLSTVVQQRNRVFDNAPAQDAALSSSQSSARGPSAEHGPIRVAEAPRFAVDDESSVAAPGGPAAKPVRQEPGSMLSQLWRSQPVWFVGGLVLLVVALRLLPWPLKESA